VLGAGWLEVLPFVLDFALLVAPFCLAVLALISAASFVSSGLKIGGFFFVLTAAPPFLPVEIQTGLPGR
jgi:hypothetical protein